MENCWKCRHTETCVKCTISGNKMKMNHGPKHVAEAEKQVVVKTGDLLESFGENEAGRSAIDSSQSLLLQCLKFCCSRCVRMVGV